MTKWLHEEVKKDDTLNVASRGQGVFYFHKDKHMLNINNNSSLHLVLIAGGLCVYIHSHTSIT